MSNRETSLTGARLRELVSRLEELASERSAAESLAHERRERSTTDQQRSFQQANEQLHAAFAEQTRQLEEEHARFKSATRQVFETQHAAAEAEFTVAQREIITRYQSNLRAVQATYQKTRQEIESHCTTDCRSATEQTDALKSQAREKGARLVDIKRQALDRLVRWDQERLASQIDEEAGVQPPVAVGDESLVELDRLIASAEGDLYRLQGLLLPRIATVPTGFWFYILLAAGSFYPAALAIGWAYGAAASTGGSLVVTLTLFLILAARARTSLRHLYRSIGSAVSRGTAIANDYQSQLQERLARQVGEWTRARDEQLEATKRRYHVRKTTIERERRDLQLRANDRGTRRLADTKYKHDRTVRREEQIHPRKLEVLRQRHEETLERVRRENEDRRSTIEREYSTAFNTLAERWQRGLADVYEQVSSIDICCRELFPTWEAVVAPDWKPKSGMPPALRIGKFDVDLSAIPQGIPENPKLSPRIPTRFALPALLTFPDECSILLKGGVEARQPIESMFQMLLLRYLTALPPGRVQFTIIDPVGLGKAFSAFMNLVDYNELLVHRRIWTETSHIDQRLAELTEHMEDVIQKYLRSRYDSIDDFNAQAGVMAEPYRVLVVANFPTNFNETAMRRLLSIAASGPRCGVYTLVSADPAAPMPSGMQLEDLEALSTVFTASPTGLVLHGHALSRLPIEYDQPPPAETMLRVLDVVGRHAKEAIRVEVPFETIAPPPETWWKQESASLVRVPLGPAGATEIQSMELGIGTAQHALIAGKTGSGKSSLFHALITNLSLLYSPDEIQVYLIDFKKGVEFKVYATYGLPHAPVVAVESEREFGLSVMQRLDAELKVRGDRFRQLGVQDLKAFRELRTGEPMPRVLFLVDEFQEFFVEEDRIAQDAALLMDRLVRQGRAFGIHVVLGSQTLGGAYALARSTVGQMGVRIALQCNEADASLILADDNTAAQFLTRPGKAIYNDAGGLVEGNHPFQVAWIGDKERERYLQAVCDLAEHANYRRPTPQIVFEGNAPADVDRNAPLNRLLQAEDWPANRHAFSLWLGDAIAIKDPTAITLRPQSGANVLLIGQNAESALAMLAMSMVALAAQHPPRVARDGTVPARFYLLDGSPPDSPIAGMLDRIARFVPHSVQPVGWRELPAVLAELDAAVQRRIREPQPDEPAIYVLVFDLQRFRALRFKEDDYSFSRTADEAPSPEKLFASILKDGPPVGVHTLVWCDSLGNLTRTLDRATIREFEMRVLFQMSSADSSNLVDNPAAASLGPNRAYLYLQEMELLEKFRPYAFPSDEWLGRFKDRLASRASAQDAPLDAAATPEASSVTNMDQRTGLDP